LGFGLPVKVKDKEALGDGGGRHIVHGKGGIIVSWRVEGVDEKKSGKRREKKRSKRRSVIEWE
jgi:hypothetical protein